MKTHKCRGSIVAFSISKSVEPNEEQKVLINSSEQGFTVNTESKCLGIFGAMNKAITSK